MELLFLKILNMSISASWLVLAVLFLRLILKKSPRWVSVLLWGFVGIRLFCPFSIESIFSLIPSAQTVSPEIMMDRTPTLSTGFGSLDATVNPFISQAFAPNPLSSANPLQILIPISAVVWLAGIGIMLLYTAISYLLLRKKVATAILLKGNIYQSEHVDSPFVLGIFRPRIYLPFGMDEKRLTYVIAHEAAHIRRKDHWWKPFGFILLALHWFNPIIWLGYILLCGDIELACDEKVIQDMDNENRADYTQALVACSVNRRSIAACPLAFGEVGIKARVKSVMHYKQPSFWILIATIAICLITAVCFLTDPKDSKSDSVDLTTNSPVVLFPWVQEYIPGNEGIIGNVDTEKYRNVSENFAIGANSMGMAVFKDPHRAFHTLTELYADAITAIREEFSLPPLSQTDYEAYKTYGWQVTNCTAKLRARCTFVSGFFDIFENSFIADAPGSTTHNAVTLPTDTELAGEIFVIEPNSLEAAVTKAILKHNASGRFPEVIPGLIPSEAHQIIGIQSSPTLIGEKEYKTELTLYVQYVYKQYQHTSGEWNTVAAIATPAVISFLGGPASGYQLLDIKEPNGGAVFADDVRNLFPADIAEILLDPQNTQIDMDALTSVCFEKAQAYQKLAIAR